MSVELLMMIVLLGNSQIGRGEEQANLGFEAWHK